MNILKGKGDDLERMLGEPKAAIRAMFLPFLIAFAIVEINQFVDTYWVSGLGNESANAVSTIVPLYGLLMCVGLGIGAGATTTIAFRLGRGEHDDASRLALNSLVMGVVLSIVASVLILLFFDPIVSMMGAGSVRAESFEYILPYIVLSPAVTLVTVLGGTLRGEGAAGRSTAIQMSSAILNMVLDPILIYGLGLGVFGAGLATVLAAGVSVLIALRWYLSGKTTVRLDRSMGIDRSAMMEVMGVGGPKTVQSLISNATDVVQRVFLIMAGGTNAVTFYNYAWRYIGLVNLPAKALDSAMIPVCSSALGQSDLERMRVGFIYTMKLAIASSIVFSVFLFLFAEPLMSIMTREATMAPLLPEFVWTLQVSVLLIPFSALMGVCSSMLQAMKRASIPMYFYMGWGVLKLVLYAMSAYGLFGIDLYEGIIYSMVAVHVFGGCALAWIAHREFERIRRVSAVPDVPS